jgi:hypothetical protein
VTEGLEDEGVLPGGNETGVQLSGTWLQAWVAQSPTHGEDRPPPPCALAAQFQMGALAQQES